MKPKTLADRLSQEIGLSVDQFSRIAGISRRQLKRWNDSHHIALKLLITGYKEEIKQ